MNVFADTTPVDASLLTGPCSLICLRYLSSFECYCGRHGSTEQALSVQRRVTLIRKVGRLVLDRGQKYARCLGHMQPSKMPTHILEQNMPGNHIAVVC